MLVVGALGMRDSHPSLWPRAGGAAACCAATITHPLDLTKYRLQTATKKQGMLKTVVLSVREDGPRSIFHGLTATWLRQASYSWVLSGLCSFHFL